MSQKCLCKFCNKELTNGCLSPSFCKPCGVKENGNIKICPICKSQYLAEYEECPSCAKKESPRG
ncbi:MAG: hypothetical protein LBO62_07695 [Endomicrobium sp.]|nr:hypothetical protein [Endomicrobium sp.]